jgi:hypothetical protein
MVGWAKGLARLERAALLQQHSCEAIPSFYANCNVAEISDTLQGVFGQK